MATKYLSIRELQPPFDVGVKDENERAVWAFNVECTKEPSATLVREIFAVLVLAGVGTVWDQVANPSGNLFGSSSAVYPKGSGPYLNVMASGGSTGLRTQNVTTGPVLEKPTAQITVRAKSSEAAEAMCRAAYAALLAVINQTITPV